MRLISFDIGIRNMAYCIFDTADAADTPTAPAPTISEWTVLNVGEVPTTETPTNTHKCSCMTKPKSTKSAPQSCIHPAKYTDPTNTKYYCMTHAKTSGFLLPKKAHEPAALKKRKAQDLYAFLQPFVAAATTPSTLATTTPPPHPQPFTKKQDALDFAKTYFATHSLNTLDQPTSQNVKEIDLLTIGRNIKTLFDQSPQMAHVTHVIIENQISPLANRMKTIQGMVAQYFIMKNPAIQIEFISSANKLKGLTTTAQIPPKKNRSEPAQAQAHPKTQSKITCRTTPQNTLVPTPPEVTQVISGTPAEPALGPTLGTPPGVPISEQVAVPAPAPFKMDKDKYKQHKSDAIAICRQFLIQNPCMTSGGVGTGAGGVGTGTDAMTSKKRDDLADCFLQGIWYLKSKNIITYAENLKINSI
jgi:hypothetical protein